MSNPCFIGCACYGKVSDSIRVKLEFVEMNTRQNYNALRVSLINNTQGVIDINVIRFADIWGTKSVRNPNFPGGVDPYIWTYQGKSEWYVYQPTSADFRTLAENINEYLELFSDSMGFEQTI